MRWALFQQVMRKLVGVRELDPSRDASAFAERLLSLHPELFAQIDGGCASVEARLAARTIALDHLREVKRLAEYVDALERSIAIAMMSPSSRLVRVAALAYILSSHDPCRAGLPFGYGLLDDCIAVRGAVLATPGRHAGKTTKSNGHALLGEFLRIRYLGIALPAEVLASAESALTFSAALAMRAQAMPKHVVEAAIRELIQNPPSQFPADLPLPELADDIEIEAVLRLLPAELVELDEQTLVFAFADGSRLRREAHGVLHDG